MCICIHDAVTQSVVGLIGGARRRRRVRWIPLCTPPGEHRGSEGQLLCLSVRIYIEKTAIVTLDRHALILQLARSFVVFVSPSPGPWPAANLAKPASHRPTKQATSVRGLIALHRPLCRDATGDLSTREYKKAGTKLNFSTFKAI